jgi:4-cresol dehydrogenase (hydroxylating) flavoprotein subunit
MDAIAISRIEDLRSLVSQRQGNERPLYPVSRGKNWGYGDAMPVTDDAVVLDLSGLDVISDFDDELGLVTVEPGVSQRQLHAFLEAAGGRWIVPTSGAGPQASVLGNALERGYGLAPYTDHFGAVTSFQAILADGSMYQGALSELGGALTDRAFKWGLGPYIDGLFTQGNVGIVVKATIGLASRPEQVGALIFRVDSNDALPAVVEVVREVLQRYGSVVQAINLMNDRRVLSMIEPYDRQRLDTRGILDDDYVAELIRGHGLGRWTGFGVLAGPKPMLRAGWRGVRRILAGYVKGLRFLTLPQVQRAGAMVRRVPTEGASRLGRKLDGLEKALLNVSGVPSEVALPLAYWLGGHRPKEGQPLDPARDGCGLIWYSPLVPMKGSNVREYAQLVEKTCVKHGIEPLITLTSVSPRCFDSTVPILFDPRQPGASERALSCYDALFDRGCERGFVPYRVPIHAMGRIIRPQAVYWQTVEKIKRALDPLGILSPGRYCPDTRG